MTRLLVSVRDSSEALDALDAGADLIDIKEPDVGSLGAAMPEVVCDVIETLNGRRPVSVALGELRDLSQSDFSFLAGAAYAKVGLAGARHLPNWFEQWHSVNLRIPPHVQPVAVIYADYATCDAPTPEVVVARAAQLKCAAVLIDTFDKSRGRLTEQWDLERLRELQRQVHQAGMLFVVAGSLTSVDLPILSTVAADYVAVRSAVCPTARTARLSRALVARFVAELNTQCATVSSGSDVSQQFA